MSLDPRIATRLKRNQDGLVCAVAQRRGTGEVLMVAWMNDEALERTLTTRVATYFSRGRQRLWVKGETSGHIQRVHEVRLDCDGDTVLLVVDQTGPACHTGAPTCFDSDVLLADDGDPLAPVGDSPAPGGDPLAPGGGPLARDAG
jgi:phosphoribosyl-AMP cyclohydrolase